MGGEKSMRGGDDEMMSEEGIRRLGAQVIRRLGINTFVVTASGVF
jgi:hypothetical protein